MNAALHEPGLRVLLVDDHTIVREGLKRILESTREGWNLGVRIAAKVRVGIVGATVTPGGSGWGASFPCSTRWPSGCR